MKNYFKEIQNTDLPQALKDDLMILLSMGSSPHAYDINRRRGIRCATLTVLRNATKPMRVKDIATAVNTFGGYRINPQHITCALRDLKFAGMVHQFYHEEETITATKEVFKWGEGFDKTKLKSKDDWSYCQEFEMTVPISWYEIAKEGR